MKTIHNGLFIRVRNDNDPVHRVNICFNSNIRSHEAERMPVTSIGVVALGYQAIHHQKKEIVRLSTV